MAKYALDLLTNENKFKIFSENSRKRAVEKFRIDLITEQYEQYYKKILNQ